MKEEYGESMGDCPRCYEPIAKGDAVDTIITEDGPRFFHWECAARMVIGGANHLLGRCACCGGSEPPDDPTLSRREQARTALGIFRALEAQKVSRDD